MSHILLDMSWLMVSAVAEMVCLTGCQPNSICIPSYLKAQGNRGQRPVSTYLPDWRVRQALICALMMQRPLIWLLTAALSRKQRLTGPIFIRTSSFGQP